MKNIQTEQERIEVAMQEESNGAIICECVRCDFEMTVEPDAEEGWCEQCDKIVNVRNPLVDNGMI